MVDIPSARSYHRLANQGQWHAGCRLDYPGDSGALAGEQARVEHAPDQSIPQDEMMIDRAANV